MTTLETPGDKSIERYVSARLKQQHMDWTLAEFPTYSEVDYVIVAESKAVGFLEVKSRKPRMSDLKLRYPDGVLLKRRKYEACSTLETVFRAPAWVMFAFGSGRDSLAVCRPHELPSRPSTSLGRRDRGLATDEEPVVLIAWDDLEVWS